MTLRQIERLIFFFIFMIYSVLGFIVETIYTSIGNRRFTHRGFLFGPYIPIYGFGAVIITYFVQPYANNPIVVFLLSFILCSLLEYITSFVMELLFKARWWDYSEQFLNIHGRICLKNSCLFGIGGVVIVNLLNTRFFKFASLVQLDYLRMIGYILFAVILIDFVVSMMVIKNISSTLDSLQGDSTDLMKVEKQKYVKKQIYHISKELQDQIKERSIIHHRLLKAFHIRIRK